MTGIADGGLQQAGPRGHEGDQCSLSRECTREVKVETLVQQHFARVGVKGDGVAGEASGGGRWWWLKGRRASQALGVVLVA